MANLTIRKMTPEVKERLRQQAAAHGHSMEEEARRILSSALGAGGAGQDNAFERLRAPFRGLSGIDLALPTRTAPREVPDIG